MYSDLWHGALCWEGVTDFSHTHFQYVWLVQNWATNVMGAKIVYANGEPQPPQERTRK